MDVLVKIREAIKEGLAELYSLDLMPSDISLGATKKEFSGEYTFVVFPLVKQLRQSPEAIGEQLGQQLISNYDIFQNFNVVKGFLNFEMSNKFWLEALHYISDLSFAVQKPMGKKMMVEFSSPNTNKPLHLGHIRNILLGWSISKIAENRGYEVIKTQVINDRGIAVCKSMMAWKKLANGEVPSDSGTKGDHFVGNYYVKFDQALQEEYKQWQESGGEETYQQNKEQEETKESFFKRFKNQYFNEYSKLGKETKHMLLEWERGEEQTMDLWRTMNSWVYDGFNETYKNLGVSFDKVNYESETYLLGKEAVEKGLKTGIFYRLDDGSVWVDLEDAGLDKKILLRSDGTSVYMTQDLGTAQMRYSEFGIDSMVYVVGDEQDYHFKVLFEILKRMEEPYASQLHHLSYGMVDLPTGKMKSREGTVVDADDLIAEVVEEAMKSSEERGAVDHLDEDAKNAIYNKIGLAALKYFIIKVNPRKRMVFDPRESVDMHGTTGPYIQNAYVRIQSVLRKAQKSELQRMDYKDTIVMNDLEKELLTTMMALPELLDESLKSYDPSVIANYCYALAKLFHRYYHENVIFDKDNLALTNFRLDLSKYVAENLNMSMSLLGIEMPDYM